MKKLLVLFALFIVSLQFFSCSTDYDGKDPVNQDPIINIYDTSDITSSKKTKIQWYGNDIDGTKLNYYYTVTTDTTLNEVTVLTALPVDGLDSDGKPNWTKTDKTYAYISMPYGAYHSTEVFMEDTTYSEVGADSITIDVHFKAVYSKFFVYGVDEEGNKTETTKKIFRRTNKIPKHPMIFSSKLGVNGFDKYWMTIGPDSAQMVLREATSFWKPFDFKWMGEDPDGTDVDLEFKWALYELTTSGEVLVVQSAGWSINNLSKSFSKDIYDHNPQGKYSFRVWVRDDAFEESLNHATVNFEVFSPELNKGILLIDDTDPTLYPASTLVNGNPDATVATAFYTSLLEYAGFKPEGQATDSLSLYRIKRFSKGEEFAYWEYSEIDDDGDPSTPPILDSLAIYRGFYDPSIRQLSQYRLVIIVSDDRSNTNGVDFAGEPPYTGYNQYLSNYLDVGGNVFLMGPSVVMGKLYVSPNAIPINKYAEAFRYVFDGTTETGQGIGETFEIFFNKYFGIYSMTFPEQRTYYTIPGTSTVQYCSDHYLGDNYDFIGAGVYEHITSETIKPLRMDSAKVNDYWRDMPGVQGRIRQVALKDNGTVFTGVPTFEAYKGEVVYRYQSIYDLPRVADNDSLSQDDGTMTHYLWCKNRVTGEIVQPVKRRSGSVATRYVAENAAFKTAFFSLPAFFLDNSENQVSDMFKTMVDWFDIKNGGKK